MTHHATTAEIITWAGQYTAGMTLQQIADAHGRQRHTIARQLRAAGIQMRPTGRRETAACGTPSGHSAHRRRREQPCDACRKAHAEASLASYHATKGDRQP